MVVAPPPIFVDATGRRRVRARRTGQAFGVIFVAYIGLLGASFARLPWVPRVSLPGLGTVLPPTRSQSPPSLGPQAKTLPAPDLTTATRERGPGVTGPSQPTGNPAGTGPPASSTSSTGPHGPSTTGPPATRPSTTGPRATGPAATAPAPATTAPPGPPSSGPSATRTPAATGRP